jgi:dihydrofolate reductase
LGFFEVTPKSFAPCAARVKSPCQGPITASTFIKLGLVDEYRLFVSPVVLGGGTPYFPALTDTINLELIETQMFASRVVYLRYQRAQGRAGTQNA